HREPIGIVERHRPQERGVDDAEDGCGGADAERESEDGDDRGAAHPGERAPRVPEIMNERIHALEKTVNSFESLTADATIRGSSFQRIHLMSKKLSLAMLALAVVYLASSRIHPAAVAPSDPNTIVDPKTYQDLRWRSAGPHRGGRSTAAAGVRTQPNVFYMGATGGGVWKTENYGITWVPVSDGQIPTGSIGAIDVADSNPNIVYTGTGSEAIRSNVILGRGVFKSTDAGRTWQSAGLHEVGQIGQLKVHPKNPDIAYVA